MCFYIALHTERLLECFNILILMAQLHLSRINSKLAVLALCFILLLIWLMWVISWDIRFLNLMDFWPYYKKSSKFPKVIPTYEAFKKHLIPFSMLHCSAKTLLAIKMKICFLISTITARKRFTEKVKNDFRKKLTFSLLDLINSGWLSRNHRSEHVSWMADCF